MQKYTFLSSYYDLIPLQNYIVTPLNSTTHREIHIDAIWSKQNMSKYDLKDIKAS